MAYHMFISSTLEQERAARDLLRTLRPHESIVEDEVFQVARVLAIAAWTHDCIPQVLYAQKLRHSLRDVVENIAASGACLEVEADNQIVQEISSIVVRFNALCDRAKEK